MKRLFAALGWMAAAEGVWAALLFLAAEFIIKRNWLAEHFLDPVYLDQPDYVESATNQMIAGFLTASRAIFAANLICAALWHISGACIRVHGPGRAAGLRLVWSVLLAIGLVLSLLAVYVYVGLTKLVPEHGMYELYGVAIVFFMLSYYIGTLFATARKLRPAVPLARLLPAREVREPART